MKLEGIELLGTYKIKFDDTWLEILDERENMIYFQQFDGYWERIEYDKKGNLIYFINKNGRWEKIEYDENNNEIYYENSEGIIIDNRVKKD